MHYVQAWLKHLRHLDSLNNQTILQLLEKALGDIHPLRRNASCGVIAYHALFLASDESSFMTGQSMIVDGGRSVVYHL